MEGSGGETGNLREELEATRAELQSIKTEAACRKLLESSNRAVDPFRLKVLATLPEADRPALVESWAQVRKASDKPAVSKSILSEGVDELYGETGEYKPKTREEFMRAIG